MTQILLQIILLFFLFILVWRISQMCLMVYVIGVGEGWTRLV